MSSVQYAHLNKFIDPELSIPVNFFPLVSDEKKSCIYLLSCMGQGQLLYIDNSFESLTGHHVSMLREKGMNYLFSLVHPGDMDAVSASIINSHKSLFNDNFNPMVPKPMVLTYRIKDRSGKWIWIRETKILVSFVEKIVDKVLGKFEELLPLEVEELLLSKMVNDQKSCGKLLEVAMVHKQSKRKELLEPVLENNSKDPTGEIQHLTRREKQILKLIADGMSTKMIANKCNISINTVETHRRHLLEKLKA